MADRDRRVQTYLTEAEHATLKQWSEETGKSMSSLLREAVLEYTDRDRTERIESELKALHEKMDDLQAHLSDDSTHTHKDGRVTKASETVEKTREIARRIQENHEPVCHVDDVERAIEDIAGGDDRTLDKYRRKLKRRGLMYEHPTGEAWTYDRDQFFRWCDAAYPDDVLPDLDAYPISQGEYEAELPEVLAR